MSPVEHKRMPVRNRLAKQLPPQWRRWLGENGIPSRKYTCVCRVSLADGATLDDVILEEGWIVGIGRDTLGKTYEQRIPFDPGDIKAIELVLVA